MKEKILDFLKEYKIFTDKRFLNKFPDFVNLLNKLFPDNFSLQQKIYHYLNNDFELKLGYCKCCGNKCKFKSLREGYTTYCSKKCSTNSKEVREKTKQTNLEKYGNTCTLHSEEIEEKTKHTNLEKYGVENPMQCESIKKKQKETYIEKYGVANPMQLKEIQNKKIKTSLKKYGTKYPSQSKVVKDKMKKTNLEKYGVEYATQAKEIKNKIAKNNLEKYGNICTLQSDENRKKLKQLFLEKYGVECTLKSKEIQDKIRKTNLEKYGVEYVTQSKEIQDKIRKTNLEKYGVEYVSQYKPFKEKATQTCLEKYGVKNPLQSKEIWNKIKQTILNRYGVEHISQAHIVKQHKIKTCLTKYGVEYVSQYKPFKEKAIQTCLEKYGVPCRLMCNDAKKYGNDSKPNLNFAKILNENNIEFIREFSLKHYIYDFKVNDILVEINPTVTHNSYFGIFHNEPLDTNYHKNKSNEAIQHDCFCIHVWDWDNLEKIVYMLKPKTTLYARNLTLKEITEKEARDFLNEYHLQNSCKGQNICVGLYDSNNLVQVMTFGKPRYNKKYEWELLRLCSHKDYKIVGGAQKMFSYFLKMYNPNSIISYCDKSKFSGNIYITLGFELKNESKPTKHWYNVRTKQHITDNLLRQRGFDQLFNANYGKGTSNEELMLQHKFLPLYDCGQMTFVYN